ncbi:MAG: hypothetical protein AAFR93_04920 [Pseudomonadota bacterium]
MTALSAYVVLEATGQWHPSAGEAARDVVVSFGKRSLVLTTTEDTPLAHWALTAVSRLDTGEGGAVFGVEGSADRLVISDPHMIEAIETVSQRAKVGATRALPRVLALTALVLTALVLAALVLAPPALRRLAVDLVPPERAALLTRDILERTPGLCRNPAAQKVLTRFAAQVQGTGGGRVLVARNWSTPVSVLPDGTLILSNEILVGASSGPSAVAGWILAAQASVPNQDLLTAWAEEAPIGAILTFLSDGTLHRVQIEDMALLNQKGRALPLDVRSYGAERLVALGLSPARYWAQAGRGAPLPVEMVPGARPALGDQDWVTLLGMCSQT